VHRHLQETTGLIRVPPQMAALARKIQALRMASPQPLSLAAIGAELGESVVNLRGILDELHKQLATTAAQRAERAARATLLRAALAAVHPYLSLWTMMAKTRSPCCSLCKPTWHGATSGYFMG
jgi:hypothetical protein